MLNKILDLLKVRYFISIKNVGLKPIFLRGSKKSEAKNLLDNDVSGGRFRRMESNINAFAGRSYAEMSEKEFRKLVKKITS